MKKIINILILISGMNFCWAQMGIGTNQPQSVLDVNGELTVRDKIYAGGSDVLIGNPGTTGQVLVSGGANNPPMWKTLNIPQINPGDYYLIYTNAFFDDNGIVFNSSASGNTLYVKGTDFSTLSGWQAIDGLTQPFQVYSNTNKIYITYEAVVHMEGTGANTGVDFACGIFIDNKLQGVRTNTAKRAADASNAFMTFLMVIISDQLTEGTHETKVACTRKENIGNYTGDFSVGTNVSTNINEFVAQSSLKVEVYEVPENFVPVVE